MKEKMIFVCENVSCQHATFACGGSVEGSKSDQAILVGGDWADMSAANTELENDGSVVLLDVVAIRQWRESMERTREHSAKGVSKISGDLFTSATLKVDMFLTSTVTQADADLEKR